MQEPVKLTWPERENLLRALEALAPGKGVAEHESDDPNLLLRYFLPTPSFQRALDPNAMIIVGERGAGKTELFRVLGSGKGFEALQANDGKTPRLIQGFGRIRQREQDHPDTAAIARAVGSGDDTRWRAFWIGLLAARLHGEGFQLGLPSAVAAVIATPARVDEWFPLVLAEYERVVQALDDLDLSLGAQQLTLVVVYDELDRVSNVYSSLFPPLRALLALWLDRWRRWAHIRPKLIIRTDLWESRLLAFPDASKLLAHKVELEWRRPWLYQMLVKRMLNTPVLRDFTLRQLVSARGRIGIQEHPVLGTSPYMDEDAFASLVTALIGEYMGANPRKGWSYEWLPNHVSDAQNRILPRPFLQLIALAAKAAIDRGQAEPWEKEPLLVPNDFFRAVQETSEVRLQELIEGRLWLGPVSKVFDDESVPMDKDDVLRCLSKTRWSDVAEAQPPTTNSAQLLDEYLVPLGIFERRPDGRYNVPDIYRHGLKMKRKGGVPRRHH